MSSVIVMRGSGTGGSESGVASIDVPQDGFILGCWVNHRAECDSDGDNSIMQISFGSTYSGVNDTRQVICESLLHSQLTTSGQVMSSQAYYIDFHNGLPVGAGERIFMHFNATAALVSAANVGLVFSFDEARARIRRG